MFDPINGIGVAYPVLLTAGHQATLWVLSFIYIIVHERLNPESRQHRKSSLMQDHNNDWKFYLKYIIPTAVATAGDIGFSNASFKFVPLTVYTIIKSSSIAFVLLFSCLFKLEKFHWKLGMIVCVMFFGVVMMVYKPSDGTEEDHNQAAIMFGSLLVLASASLSGLRWVYTQLILKKTPSTTITIVDEESSPRDGRSASSDDSTAEVIQKADEKPHPIYTIYQLAPIMAVTLILTSLVIERPLPGIFHSNLFRVKFEHDNTTTIASISRGIFLMILPGIDVFVLTFCEFGILQLTKVLTLSIAGIVKEVLTILTGMIFLHERISGIYNWIGMSIVLLDVVYYNHFRYKQKQEKEYIELSTSESSESMSKFPASGAVEPFSAATDFTMQEFEMDALSLSLSQTSAEMQAEQMVPMSDVGPTAK